MTSEISNWCFSEMAQKQKMVDHIPQTSPDFSGLCHVDTKRHKSTESLESECVWNVWPIFHAHCDCWGSLHVVNEKRQQTRLFSWFLQSDTRQIIRWPYSAIHLVESGWESQLMVHVDRITSLKPAWLSWRFEPSFNNLHPNWNNFGIMFTVVLLSGKKTFPSLCLFFSRPFP